MEVLLDRCFIPLLQGMDRVRALALRRLGPLAPQLLRDRALRLVVLAGLAVGMPLLLTAFAPFWLLALGPVVFGMPHLLADVRYLVLRPAMHRKPGFSLVLIPLFATWIRPSLVAGLCAPLCASLCFPSLSVGRRLLASTVCVAALLCAAWAGRKGDLAFAHLHNVVALLVWGVSTGRRYLNATVVLFSSFAAGSSLILTGAFDSILAWVGFLGAPEADLLIEELWGSLSCFGDSIWSLRLVLWFAFAQSVHYAVWLRLLPEACRERPGLCSFTSSYRTLGAEGGKGLLALCTLLTVALLGWACLEGLTSARSTYLRFATFHGPLELTALVLFALTATFPLSPVSIKGDQL